MIDGKDYDQIFVDQDNDELYFKQHDSQNAERVKMVRLSELIKIPELPDLKPVSGAHLLETWNKLNDDDVFDKTNANWQTLMTDLANIESNTKSVYQWSTDLSNVLKQLLNQSDVNITQILGNSYYSKEEVQSIFGGQIADLQTQIRKLNSLLTNGRTYSGAIATNISPTNQQQQHPMTDESGIQDAAAAKKVNEWNKELGGD